MAVTIARRRVQDELRRRVRRPEVATESPPEVATDEELNVRDDLALALALARRLPDDQADAVLAAHDQEPVPMHSRSRLLKLGVLAGAAVVSLAGAAAATGVLPDRQPAPPTGPTIVVAPSASAVTMPQLSTTTSIAAAATAAVPATTADTSTTVATDAAAAAAPAVSAPPCPPDVVNHGDYVSRVARDTPPGPDHGTIVAAAAQSDCGKPTAPPASAPAAAASTGHGSSDDAASGHAHSRGNNGGGHGHSHG